MKIEISKEFVLEAYNAACGDWKKRIEEELPELFEVKLEVGRWYKNKKFDGIINITEIEKFTDYSRIHYFGVYDGNWVDKDYNANKYWEKYYILATKEEIEEMLWKEAEKRGIGKDTKLEFHADTKEYFDNDGDYHICYNPAKDEMWNIHGCVYSKGRWSKPLYPNKEIKETISRLEKELKELKEKVK